MSYGEFSVYQFFADGTYEEVHRHVDAATAFDRVRALIRSVGAAIGNTCRVIITDGSDLTTFECIYGEGIAFPTREQLADNADV